MVIIIEKGDDILTTMFLIDVENQRYETVQIGSANEVEEIHTLLNCSYFELNVRKIEGKYYGIYMDEEGRLTDKPISAISYTQSGAGVMVEDFRGNLLIFNMPTHGTQEQSLTTDDVAVIRRHLRGLGSHGIILTDFSI